MTLTVGQADPHTIPSSCFMRGTHTHNLVIPGQFVPSIVGGKEIIPDGQTNGRTYTERRLAFLYATIYCVAGANNRKTK